MKVSEMTNGQLKRRYKELLQLNRQATKNRDLGMIGSVRRQIEEIEAEMYNREVWKDDDL